MVEPISTAVAVVAVKAVAAPSIYAGIVSSATTAITAVGGFALTYPAITGPVLGGAVAFVNTKYKHKLDTEQEDQKARHQTEAELRAHRIAGYARIIEGLKNGQCGYISDPNQYRKDWEEITNYYPDARYSQGAAFAKCLEGAVHYRQS